MFSNYTVRGFLWLQFLRLHTIFDVNFAINMFIGLVEASWSLTKNVVKKASYSVKVILLLFLTMHLVACVWVNIGHAYYDAEPNGSWLTAQVAADEDLDIAYTEWTKYIAAFYWVMVTLTTVGYGDIYGFTV